MRSFIVIGLLAASASWASTPFKTALTMKMNSYLTDGVVVGGSAGPGASILGVRRIYSAKAQIERMVIDIGDKDGKATGKVMSYFQASVDAKENRVELDIPQLRYNKVNEQQLKTLFKTSPYVADVEMTMDPEDKAGTIVLKLKRPMQLEVFELLDKKKSARVVLDLKPARVTQVKR